MTLVTHQSATTLKLHIKVLLSVVALVLLNLASIEPQSLSWQANANLHQYHRLEFWPQTKSLLVNLKQNYTDKLEEVSQLAQAHYEELSQKSFKIVKVESRRIESSFIWPVTGRITSELTPKPRRPAFMRNQEPTWAQSHASQRCAA